MDSRHDRPVLVGYQRVGKRVPAPCAAKTRDLYRASCRRILAGIRASGQECDHDRTIALASGRPQRITGQRVSEYWRITFAEPLELDIWIGLPEAERKRAATIYAAKAGGEQTPAEFYRELITPGTLVRKTFNSPAGLHSIAAMNTGKNRSPNIV